MSRYSLSVFLGLAVLSLLTSLRAARAQDAPDVKATMNRNFNALMNLQSFAADPKVFADPKNRDEIEKNLEAMSGLTHIFPQKLAGQEPGLAAISSLFSDYLKEVQRSFKSGANGSFVRNQVRTMMGLCMSCHTRVSTNQSFTDLKDKVDSTPLTDFQRAEFYAATRQFDRAIKAFDVIISETPSGEFGYLELGRSVREALSITIRVKQDPKATFYILEKLATRDDLPEFFQRYVAEWKKDVTKWMGEKKRPKDMTATELMNKADALVDQATKRQLFPVDPSGDVNYLRATNYIHEALTKDPKGKFRGEALYLLGSCYDTLQDPMLWALDSLYFEACVREFPHSAVSRKCYHRYAAKLYFGYSGSGGTFIPEDEIKKLTELRKLTQ
ncbi:MAG: hypothetical protein HY074_08500 [Deltaproteobacteria bacterium]|nr:hypothetical protein [Deltaproteobacteria bacterium]